MVGIYWCEWFHEVGECSQKSPRLVDPAVARIAKLWEVPWGNCMCWCQREMRVKIHLKFETTFSKYITYKSICDPVQSFVQLNKDLTLVACRIPWRCVTHSGFSRSRCQNWNTGTINNFFCCLTQMSCTGDGKVYQPYHFQDRLCWRVVVRTNQDRFSEHLKSSAYRQLKNVNQV